MAIGTMAAIAAATTSTAVLRPSAVAVLSASPLSPSVPEVATRTSTARPTAAPTEVLMDAMPEAMPSMESPSWLMARPDASADAQLVWAPTATDWTAFVTCWTI